jgi:hypothetical protein
MPSSPGIVGLQALRLLDRLVAVARLADDLQAVLERQEVA